LLATPRRPPTPADHRGQLRQPAQSVEAKSRQSVGRRRRMSVSPGLSMILIRRMVQSRRKTSGPTGGSGGECRTLRAGVTVARHQSIPRTSMYAAFINRVAGHRHRGTRDRQTKAFCGMSIGGTRIATHCVMASSPIAHQATDLGKQQDRINGRHCMMGTFISLVVAYRRVTPTACAKYLTTPIFVKSAATTPAHCCPDRGRRRTAAGAGKEKRPRVSGTVASTARRLSCQQPNIKSRDPLIELPRNLNEVAL
jgi:hypothetical protein